MLNVRLAGGHLYGKQLFTWLSLVVSLMASFVLSFFPLDVLDEIWDLIESVSEGFLTYSLSLLLFFFLCPFHCCCVCLACDSSIVATCPSIQLPALPFDCGLFVLFLLFVVVSLVNQSRTKGKDWSTTN